MQQLARLRAARAREAQMNYKRRTNPHAMLLKKLRESSWSPQLRMEKSDDLESLNRNMVFFDARVSSSRYADIVKNIEGQLSKLEYSKWASLPIMVVAKWKDAFKNGASKFPGFVIIPQDFNTQELLRYLHSNINEIQRHLFAMQLITVIPLAFAAVVLGQTEAPNAANMMAPTPANVAEPTPVNVAEPMPVNVAEPTPVNVAEPMPVNVAESTPVNVAESTPVAYEQQPTEMDAMSLLNRLVSFFDFSHVANAFTTVPVLMAPMYNPDTSKFTILSASIMRQGDTYFMPVCPVSAIASAGPETPAAAVSSGCTMGVQLTPMPINAASSLYEMLKAKLRIIASLAKPSFRHMYSGMMRNMMPGSYAMAQEQPQTAAM
ncbi:hypothetical protein IWW42_004394 [Coemansia sp. RSA 1085]|nr:hypothetical protein IWW42_004394 [Coemansia sp. RSA 1085]